MKQQSSPAAPSGVVRSSAVGRHVPHPLLSYEHTHTHTHPQRSQTNTAARAFLFSSFPSIPESSAEMIHGGVIRRERCWPQWLWLHSPRFRAEVNRQWTHTLFKAVCWRGLCSRVAQGRLEGRRVRSFSPGCYKTSRGCWHSGNHVQLNPTFFFALSHSHSFNPSPCCVCPWESVFVQWE